jgi:hypothetical protein
MQHNAGRRDKKWLAALWGQYERGETVAALRSWQGSDDFGLGHPGPGYPGLESAGLGHFGLGHVGLDWGLPRRRGPGGH